MEKINIVVKRDNPCSIKYILTDTYKAPYKVNIISNNTTNLFINGIYCNNKELISSFIIKNMSITSINALLQQFSYKLPMLIKGSELKIEMVNNSFADAVVNVIIE